MDSSRQRLSQISVIFGEEGSSTSSSKTLCLNGMTYVHENEDSIIVPDLDDARRTKRSLSLNADFEMQKECFESTCPSVPFACSNGCQRSDLQSPLKAITIRFYQDNYAKRVGSSTQGHLSRSTSFDSDEQSNMTETANASVEKFLTRKETERGREYKMTWPDNWMSEAEMMNTLDMILTFMSEKVRDN